MSKHYAHIRTIEQLQREQDRLHERIRLSEKLLRKDYEKVKRAFSLPQIVTNLTNRLIGLSGHGGTVGVVTSLLSLLLKKKKEKKQRD